LRRKPCGTGMVSIRQSAPPSILPRYCAESVCIECFGCPHGAARRYAAAPRSPMRQKRLARI